MNRDEIKIHSFQTLSPEIVYERPYDETSKRIFIVDGLSVRFIYKNTDATIIINTDRVLDYEEMKDKIMEEFS